MNYIPGRWRRNSAVGAKPLDQARPPAGTAYSLRTEQAYLSWIRRFFPASSKRHPSQMGQARVEAFLTRLATDAQVSAARRTRRLAVLLFFYREVLRIDRHDVPDEIPSCHNLG